jgi:hypothetical protein
VDVNGVKMYDASVDQYVKVSAGIPARSNPNAGVVSVSADKVGKVVPIKTEGNFAKNVGKILGKTTDHRVQDISELQKDSVTVGVLDHSTESVKYAGI